MLRLLQYKNKRMTALSVVLVFSCTVFVAALGTFAQETQSGNTTVLDLNDEIRSVKQKIKDLEAQKEEYKREIEGLRSQSVSLGREIALLENRTAQIEVDIAEEQARIDQTSLEIQNTDREILKTEKVIDTKKMQLGKLIRKLGRVETGDYLSILLFNDSFSDFFDGLKYLETVENDVFTAFVDVETTKKLLEEEKKLLAEKKERIIGFKIELEQKMASLDEEQTRKAYLLSATHLSERQFQNLILDVKKEQDKANAEIISLERKIRDRLAREQALSSLGGDETFTWPVDPSRGISAYFHDPDYPYRYLFEHPAIDIRTPQGTPIHASKSGYVARAKDAGMGYSYIMLIHDDNITTVYSHVSRIDVRDDDFVVQGQVIGLSGGTPGTPGAGKLSTGPHLHFEVRVNGIPVNPLDYLP